MSISIAPPPVPLGATIKLADTERGRALVDSEVNNPKEGAPVLEKVVTMANTRISDAEVRLKDLKAAFQAAKEQLASASTERLDSKTLKVLEGLLKAKEDSDVASHKATLELRKLANVDLQGSPLAMQAYKKCVVAVDKLNTIACLPSDRQISPRTSGEFFDDLLGMIDFIKEDYLTAYEGLLAKYSEFYKEFNAEIMAHMGTYVQTGFDHTKPDSIWILGALYADLEKLKQKYSGKPAGVLYPPAGAAGVSLADAEKWAAAMGIPESCISQDSTGMYVVMIDLSSLTEMQRGIWSGGSTEFSSAEFQAWQVGFNSQESELKNQLQLYTTKYSNANSYYENFNKILSSQLSQFAEMLKQMANSFA